MPTGPQDDGAGKPPDVQLKLTITANGAVVFGQAEQFDVDSNSDPHDIAAAGLEVITRGAASPSRGFLTESAVRARYARPGTGKVALEVVFATAVPDNALEQEFTITATSHLDLGSALRAAVESTCTSAGRWIRDRQRTRASQGA